ALPEQTVARPLPAIELVRGCLVRDVDIAGFGIGAQHGPCASGPGVEVAAFLPCIAAGLARLSDGAELPDFLAGPHVEATDIARRALLVAPARHDHLRHHDVAYDESRRDRADIRHRRAFDDSLAQINPAIAAESCRHFARL